MPRPRRFAAPLVIVLATPAACSSNGAEKPPPPFGHDFAAVWKDGSACGYAEAMSCPEGVRCNPPPPRAIECPREMGAHERVRIGADGAGGCLLVPPTCADRGCAVPTDCPEPGQMLPPLQWAVNPGDGDGCVASPGPRTGLWEPAHAPAPIACPLPERHGFIERAAPDAPCFACAKPPCADATPVPCPDGPS